MAAAVGMDAPWMEAPDKWAPCGSDYREYGRRPHTTIFFQKLK
jgi:hypothetical protein